MGTEIPTPSSSQQPYAQPQPAPVPATSPPTKQSLKSWWKGFRPPAKSQEAPGNYLSPVARSSQLSASRILRNYESVFHESPMDDSSPTLDGIPDTGQGPSYLEKTSSGDSESQVFQAETPFARKLSNSRVRASSSLPCPTSSSYDPAQSAGPGSGILRSISEAPCFAEETRIPKKKLYISHLLQSCSHLISTKLEAKRCAIIVPPSGIFGIPLRTSITYANVAISLVDANGKSYIYGYVPIVVAKCGVYLKEKGKWYAAALRHVATNTHVATNVEGIFRLSGSAKRIKELAAIFDSPDRYGKGLDWAGYTVHDAANVLRRYLNQLPEPIVPLDLYDRFRAPLRGHTREAVGDNEGTQLDSGFDVDTAIVTYQHLITELPPLNRQLLLYILDLLAVFASKSDENRMTSQNLAAIFQPGMLSHPMHDMSPPEYRLSQDVLIFLIENQDHFLIGMRGTEADEKTVNEVQSGAGTPTTPSRNSNTIGRSASNASAGADSVRKFGGVRRNVSVSSRHSRQSNGAPSPATPTYGSQTASGGMHRSNTVPSKISPNIAQGRMQKHSGSPSPVGAIGNLSSQSTVAPRGLSPADHNAAMGRRASPTSSTFPPSLLSPPSLASSSHGPSTVTSQDRLLGDSEKHPEIVTPSKERNVSSFFQRSPTVESERKPNKLRKKRIPSSSNPSAQSSTHSLHQSRSDSVSPGLHPTGDVHDIVENRPLETILSSPALSDHTTTAPNYETPRNDLGIELPSRPADTHHSSDQTLKPKESPVSSLHSRSSFNDQSDLDHADDAAAASEQKEKRSKNIWRLSRRKERDDHNQLSPPKAFGSDAGAGASSSSIGSSARPRKSSTGEPLTLGTDFPTNNALPNSAIDSNSAIPSEDKKGPLGWFKKIREKREEAEKDRAKSPPASTERLNRGKSMDIKRENPDLVPDDQIPQSAR